MGGTHPCAQEARLEDARVFCVLHLELQGYLAHKKTPPRLRPP